MRFLVVLGVALLAAAAWAFSFTSGGGLGEGTPRELVLVARDMTFRTPSAASANPTLRLRAGERIRLVLENRDPGMRHDVVAPGLGIRTAAVDFGGSARRLVRVPRTPGQYDYFCSFHDRLMRGRMVVE